MRAVRALALALTLCAMAPASAMATATPAHDDAVAALQHARALLHGTTTGDGHDLTAALVRLAHERPALGPGGRRAADRLLARPTDGDADPEGSGYTHPEAAPRCSAHFCVHYVTRGPDRPLPGDANHDGVPDFVDTVDRAFERSYAVENGTLGWRAPVPDHAGVKGRNRDKVDVYIGDPGGLAYGYTAPEPDADGFYETRSPAYVVINNTFAGFPGTPAEDAEVTAAHEYNHVLQDGYDLFQELWTAESTAVWAEHQVFPQVRDYLQYLPAFSECPATPLTKGAPFAFDDLCQLKIYASAVWDHWLTARFGPAVIRSSQELSAANDSVGPYAYGAAIRRAGGRDFQDEFARFATATAEWRVAPSPFPDAASYPDVDREPTRLTVGGAGVPLTRLDNTTARMFDVRPDPAHGTLVAHVDVPPGIKGALALVGRTGKSATSGRVLSAYAQTARGGPLEVTLPDRADLGRVTVVVVNATATAIGYDDDLFEVLYAGNRAPFRNVRVTAR
jgi:hypothetical protein